MKNSVNSLSNFIVISAACLLLLACSDDSHNIERKFPENPLLLAATSADNPPYEYMQNGKIVGIDVDIINNIASSIERDVEIQNLDFSGLLQALSSKNVDLVIAALSVTEERKKHVDFSIPYLSTTVALLYRDTKPLLLNSMLANKTIGVQLGTTWAETAHHLKTDVPNMQVRALSNNLVLVEELKGGMIDGVILEEEQAKKFITMNPELSYRPLPEFTSEFAIALPKGSPLLGKINDAITRLKDAGILDHLQDKWRK